MAAVAWASPQASPLVAPPTVAAERRPLPSAPGTVAARSREGLEPEEGEEGEEGEDGALKE